MKKTLKCIVNDLCIYMYLFPSRNLHRIGLIRGMLRSAGLPHFPIHAHYLAVPRSQNKVLGKDQPISWWCHYAIKQIHVQYYSNVHVASLLAMIQICLNEELNCLLIEGGCS